MQQKGAPALAGHLPWCRYCAHVEPEESDPPLPPDDADDWTNDQWIDWLNATDVAVPSTELARPATAAGRVVHSTGGHLLGQTMLGLAQAIYGPRETEIVVVADANSEPESDREFELHLDGEHPERSTVVVRPPATDER